MAKVESSKSRIVSGVALAGFGAVVAGAAWMAAKYSPRDPDTRLWYQRLDKPEFTPPDYVFPVVWTSLYVLIAISGWRIWEQEDSPERSRALRLWVTQLAMNARWTKLFFGEHRPWRALVEVLSLEAILLCYMRAASKVDRTAAGMFLPYAVWLGFAALLNEEIARRNPGAGSLAPQADLT